MIESNLKFLENADNEDLLVLTDYIIKDKNGNLRWTEGLSKKSTYKLYYPDRLSCMVGDITNELSLFAGNTFVNWIRGGGVDYDEILMDVCDKNGVNYNKNSPIEVIEMKLLQTIFINSLENMDQEEMEKVMKEMNIPHNGLGKQAMTAALLYAIKRGGFASYKIAVIVANAVAKAILGRGLSYAANAGLTRWLSIFAGPIGWALTAVWTAIDLAGPAYRVTIPAVIQIAYMRAKMNYELNNPQVG